MTEKKFSVKDRLRSFRYAWEGLKWLFLSEHNTWIHLFLSIVSVVLGIVLKISRYDWMALFIVIVLVWVCEIINTAIEKTMDFISKEWHPQIKLIKDIAAAAVLVAAIGAVIVGCFIFIPKLLPY
jgi:diacylglycerol kinase